MLTNSNVLDRCKEAVCDILYIKILQSAQCAYDHINELCTYFPNCLLLASVYKWNHLKHTCQNIFPYKDSDTRFNFILVNTIYYQWRRNNTIILQQRSIVKHWSDKKRQSMKLLIFTLRNYKECTINLTNRVIFSGLKIYGKHLYLWLSRLV